VHAFFSYQMHATCLAYLIALMFDDYKLWSSLLCNFLCFFLGMRDEVAGDYKTEGKITLYVFSCLGLSVNVILICYSCWHIIKRFVSCHYTLRSQHMNIRSSSCLRFLTSSLACNRVFVLQYL
jgi:hypothetical protein